MYRNRSTIARTSIDCNESYEGETIEEKVNRIVNNKEPIKDGAPLVYSDRKDGVLAGTNIRTDRFEIATEAADHIAKSKVAKREAKVVDLKAKEGGEAKSEGKEGAKTEQKTPGTGDEKSSK